MHAQAEALWTLVRARWEQLHRQPEAGYSTETVLVTALLVVAALAVVSIMAAKVIEKANGITL
ncbi:hypothetical protein [Saccharothrix longispora]|uniref:hypothetical protein n=1 Tax=Saccharothrix longispora TaxID=33920 RepID=UPI0028FDA559|nr:hypothetical protein [Saccharothrix longispora]MDU0295116.1 hypothetical protein [Saccharothrix longispora]